MGFFYERMHLSLCVISFKCSIDQFLEHRELTRVIAVIVLTNFTFVLQRISKRKFLIIFCYAEVLFPKHSESNGTHIFLVQAVQSVQKISFQRYSGRNFQGDKCSSPKSKQYFRKKMSVMELVFFFFVMFRAFSAPSVFSSIYRPPLLC